MYERILVPVDSSPTSNRGLQEAVKLARLTGAKLRLIHVIDAVPHVSGLNGFVGYSVDLFQRLNEGGQNILADAKARAQAAGLEAETVIFDDFTCRLCEHVVDEATTWHADLIVLGTHGRRGFRRFVLGSDAEQIVRSAPVPVLLVRGDETDAPPAAAAGSATPNR
ncbi:MAG: universal stress protein [Methylibium sp.]|nr:universal stress protein [Methylibium sp.]